MARPLLNRFAAGLPEKGTLVHVTHNRAASKTLVEFKLPGTPVVHRLFWRAGGGEAYSAVGAFDSNDSLCDLVTCEEPFLFACGIRWTKRGDSFVGNSLGVLRATLADTPTIEWLPIDEILPPGGWVSRILRADDRGDCLDVIAAFKDAEPFRHAICRIDLRAKSFTELDRLPGVFF